MELVGTLSDQTSGETRHESSEYSWRGVDRLVAFYASCAFPRSYTSVPLSNYIIDVIKNIAESERSLSLSLSLSLSNSRREGRRKGRSYLIICLPLESRNKISLKQCTTAFIWIGLETFHAPFRPSVSSSSFARSFAAEIVLVQVNETIISGD